MLLLPFTVLPLNNKLIDCVFRSVLLSDTFMYLNNINSQLDATITNFIDNFIQLEMFRAIISPILRSTRMCLQLVVQCIGGAACRQ